MSAPVKQCSIRNSLSSGERLLCQLKEFEIVGMPHPDRNVIEIQCRQGIKKYAHRALLQIASPFFQEILKNNDSLESLSLDVTSEIFNLILDFIYTTQQLKFDTTQVVELYAASKQFQIDDLAEEIRENFSREFLAGFLEDSGSLRGVSDADIGVLEELLPRVTQSEHQRSQLTELLNEWSSYGQDREGRALEIREAISTREPIDCLELDEESAFSCHFLTFPRGQGDGLVRRVEASSDGQLSIETVTPFPRNLWLAKDRCVVGDDEFFALDLQKGLKIFKLVVRLADHPVREWKLVEKINRPFNGIACQAGNLFMWDEQFVYSLKSDMGVRTRTRLIRVDGGEVVVGGGIAVVGREISLFELNGDFVRSVSRGDGRIRAVSDRWIVRNSGTQLRMQSYGPDGAIDKYRFEMPDHISDVKIIEEKVLVFLGRDDFTSVVEISGGEILRNIHLENAAPFFVNVNRKIDVDQ